MSRPWLWTVLLLGVAGAILLLERGVIGWVLVVFVLVLILIMWLLPHRASIRAAHEPSSVTEGMAKGLLGIMIGIIGALLAVLFLPPQYFSWLLILVGVLIFGWLIWSRR